MTVKPFSGLCPECGMWGIIKELHRPDGSYPSEDKYCPPYYKPLLRCERCIEKYHLETAKHRRMRGAVI